MSSFPTQIVDEPAALADAAADQRSHGVLLGIFGAIFAYNLLLWVFLRDPVYSIYPAYLACTFMTSSLINGNGATFFYPGVTWPTLHLVVPVGCAAFWLLFRFTRLFLRTSDHARLDVALRCLEVAVLVLGAASPLLPRQWAMSALSTLVIVVPLGCVAAGAIGWRAGRTEARFYLAGNLCSILSLLVVTALTLGVAPVTRATAMAFSYGTALDGVLLAFALADRIRVMRRAGHDAERREREALATRATELERMVAERTAQLERIALTDSLTGAANRHGFEQAARRIEEDDRPGAGPCAVLMIDLDHFKSVNDRFGHDVGDRVLRETARTVAAHIRAADIFSRIGGEEFVVVARRTADDEVRALAERLRAAVASTVSVGDPPEPVTISIGVAIGGEDAFEPVDVLRRLADSALYRAKELGRNCVVIAQAAPGDHLEPVPVASPLRTSESR